MIKRGIFGGGEIIDFLGAWEIARAVPIKDHDERCSYRVSNGGCLCDCYVLVWHEEYEKKKEEVKE